MSRLLQFDRFPHRAATPALVAVDDFGTDPGGLLGWSSVPAERTDMPLVVVLHGCTQTAAGYDRGAGWSALGQRHGYAVLLPEQQRANNPNGCFNWFSPSDTRRDAGEALSIRQMIGAMLARHPIDAGRVFITGLSAGGAMTSVMLATYPEMFAGGGIIAGLPYGAASSVPQALERMRGQGIAGEREAAAVLRAASPHTGPWPSISVWHGDGDHTVHPDNADAIVDQWRGVHCANATPDRVERVDGQQRRLWLDHDGKVAIEAYRIAGMGHGTPLKLRGEGSWGEAGPHMLDAGISSTLRLAEHWGLLDPAAAQQALSAATQPAEDRPHRFVSVDTQTTIETALRAAGLMR